MEGVGKKKKSALVVSSCAANWQQKTEITNGPFFLFVFSFQFYVLLFLAGWILHEERRFKGKRLACEVFGGMLAQRRQAVPHVSGKREPITRDRSCTALPREATESRITGHTGGFKIKYEGV